MIVLVKGGNDTTLESVSKNYGLALMRAWSNITDVTGEKGERILKIFEKLDKQVRDKERKILKTKGGRSKSSSNDSRRAPRKSETKVKKFNKCFELLIANVTVDPIPKFKPIASTSNQIIIDDETTLSGNSNSNDNSGRKNKQRDHSRHRLRFQTGTNSNSNDSGARKNFYGDRDDEKEVSFKPCVIANGITSNDFWEFYLRLNQPKDTKNDPTGTAPRYQVCIDTGEWGQDAKKVANFYQYLHCLVHAYCYGVPFPSGPTLVPSVLQFAKHISLVCVLESVSFL